MKTIKQHGIACLLAVVGFVDSHSQNVGINTNNPDCPLTIGNSLLTPNLISFRHGTNATWSFQQTPFSAVAYKFNFVYNPTMTSVLSLQPDGKIGVGTTLPTAGLHVVGSIKTDDKLILNSNQGIQYQNGEQLLNDWRLVSRDDFETGTDGWIMTTATSSAPVFGATRVNSFFKNTLLSNSFGPSNQLLFKKTFSFPSLNFTEVMVRFSYFFIDSWDNEQGVLGFSDNPISTKYIPIWSYNASHRIFDNNEAFDINFTLTERNSTEMIVSGIAFFRIEGQRFTLAFGATLDELPFDESFGIDNVEVWVR
jgi:hypothetical protein